jgi:aspartate carbamoyltransferase catalytic subunit
MNRGLEISADAADSPRSVIVEQVANGVAVRMAVLYLLLSGDGDTGAPPATGAVPVLTAAATAATEGTAR